MPHHVWGGLTKRGQLNNRFTHAAPGVWPARAGVRHPLAAGWLAAFEAMGGSEARKADVGMGKTVGKGTGEQPSANAHGGPAASKL